MKTTIKVEFKYNLINNYKKILINFSNVFNYLVVSVTKIANSTNRKNLKKLNNCRLHNNYI